MDYLFRLARFLICICLFSVSGPVLASCYSATGGLCPSPAVAEASCDTYGKPGVSEHKCNHTTGTNSNGTYEMWTACCHGGTAGYDWYGYRPTPVQCAAHAPLTGYYAEGASNVACHDYCGYYLADGVNVATKDGRESGLSGTWNPTGSTCGGTDTLPPPATPSKLCGGGSCYDPVTDTYIAVDASGNQISVPGSAGRAGQSGGCDSSASATLCSGSPPPSPPAPPASPISDPPTEIQHSDHYTEHVSVSDGSGGASVTNITKTVNTYGASGTGAVGSGQGSDDSGPAAASTAPTPSRGTVSGGSDCNTPPVCSGDAIACATLYQQWETRCQAQKVADALKATGQPPEHEPPTQDDVWSEDGDVPTTGDAIADAANQGSYDETGFGYSNACPLHDLVVPVGSHAFTVPFASGCFVGGWIRAIVIAFALFAAIRITAGGRG